MLRAEELRIGNWVLNYKDTPTQILEWTGNEAYLTQGRKAYGIKTSRPIELTEEWLMKFGFFINHYESSIEEVVVYQSPEHGIPLFEEDNIWYAYNLDVHIKSVHQLQNLYFALTGEELTLKQ